ATTPLATTVCANDLRADRKVVVKALHRIGWLDAAETAARRQRVFQSCEPLIALQHPGLVEVLEVGEFEKTLFLVREYVPQKSFRLRLEACEPVSLLEARQIASQVGEALNALAAIG